MEARRLCAYVCDGKQGKLTKAISSETDGNNGLHTYGQIPSTSECEESQDEILAVALEIFIGETTSVIKRFSAEQMRLFDSR